MHGARRFKCGLSISLVSVVALVGAVTLSVSLQGHPRQAHAAGASRQSRLNPIPTNIDVSQRSGNESEETVAVNPTNPNNIVIVTNVDHPAAGMFAAVSFNGGTTWNTRLLGDTPNLANPSSHPTLPFHT